MPLDLSDLDDVAACAERLPGQVDHLDVLMNNAGVMAVPLARTAQGFEMQMGTNHLGHFALTGRVLPLLLAADAPRVVTVSSFGHKPGRIRWDDPNWQKGRYHAWPAYFQTKLANLLFTAELDRQAGEAGTKLLAAAAHPGYASTNLTTSGPGSANALMRGGGQVVDRVFGQSDTMGALPQLYAATMPDVDGNDYWGPDGFLEQRGHPTTVGRTRRAAGRRRRPAPLGPQRGTHRRHLRLGLSARRRGGLTVGPGGTGSGPACWPRATGRRRTTTTSSSAPASATTCPVGSTMQRAPEVLGAVARGADPVHAHDVRLVLDGPGHEQRPPVGMALGRPVGDHHEAVGVRGLGPQLVAEAQVVADRGAHADAVDLDGEGRRRPRRSGRPRGRS